MECSLVARVRRFSVSLKGGQGVAVPAPVGQLGEWEVVVNSRVLGGDLLSVGASLVALRCTLTVHLTLAPNYFRLATTLTLTVRRCATNDARAPLNSCTVYHLALPAVFCHFYLPLK